MLAPDVARYMSECGLVPIARDFESRSRIQYNVIYLHSSLLSDPGVRASMTDYLSAISHPQRFPVQFRPPA